MEYMANITSSPDPNVQLEYFSGEVCSAWEIFFNVWLGSKEAKVTRHFSTAAREEMVNFSLLASLVSVVNWYIDTTLSEFSSY